MTAPLTQQHKIPLGSSKWCSELIKISMQLKTFFFQALKGGRYLTDTFSSLLQSKSPNCRQAELLGEVTAVTGTHSKPPHGSSEIRPATHTAPPSMVFQQTRNITMTLTSFSFAFKATVSPWIVLSLFKPFFFSTASSFSLSCSSSCSD